MEITQGQNRRLLTPYIQTRLYRPCTCSYCSTYYFSANLFHAKLGIYTSKPWDIRDITLGYSGYSRISQMPLIQVIDSHFDPCFGGNFGRPEEISRCSFRRKFEPPEGRPEEILGILSKKKVIERRKIGLPEEILRFLSKKR